MEAGTGIKSCCTFGGAVCARSIGDLSTKELTRRMPAIIPTKCLLVLEIISRAQAKSDHSRLPSTALRWTGAIEFRAHEKKSSPGQSQGMMFVLEAVMQRELYLPGRRPRACNLAEVLIGYEIVWIPVTRNIEQVEEIRTESNRMTLRDVEIFVKRRIDLTIARCALGIYAGRPISAASGHSISANPIVRP